MSSAFDDLMNDPEISDSVKQRITDLKNNLRITDDDPLLSYLAEFGFLHRLFEGIPRHIREAAEAESKRLNSETSNIISRAAETISKESSMASMVAQEAANQAAQELVRKIDKAVLVKAEAQAWRYRMGAIAGALGLSSAAAVLAAIMTPLVPGWVFSAHSNHSNALARILIAVWNAPVGWVIFLCGVGAVFACLAEDAAIKTAERLTRERP